MKKHEYVIPEGCKKISIEADLNNLIITFNRADVGEFLSPITEEMEQMPLNGDIAIFWDERRDQAIIAKCVDWSREDGIHHKASDGNWYKNAIKFRCGDQYNSVLGDENTEK